ncbi:LuxR family transcriptional regulator [Microbacterium terrae]|uniref:HTH luxR-type domain-containing protein n=1 Tax=Microbacterium terrae TaxID=69369 RepID=A0A0M2HEH0_9MICO|nr:hypothetical protein RS81_01118 [Microbacterium terrae]GLJ98446.1 hypothetical protein GCM10017594_16430 [Microbacterium terrae]
MSSHPAEQHPVPDQDLLAEAGGMAPGLMRAYRVLLTASSSDAAQLAAALGVDEATAAASLTQLASAGFAAPLAIDARGAEGRRFVAAPPSVALGAAVAAREEAVQRAQADLGSLQELYRMVSRGGDTADDVVQVVRGADDVAQWFTRVQSEATSEVCAFVQHPVAVTAAHENGIEDELVARGVLYRVVLERAMLESHAEGLDSFAESLAAGEEARVVDSLPVRMVIVDRELAFMPVPSDRDRAFAAALLVRPSALLTGLIALFDLTWSMAAPIVLDATGPVSGVGVVDALDARLLSLLLAGQTDEAAASHLGVSLRTVQRRVRDLMDRAGVRTRAQLGWHAARAGWDAAGTR